MQQRQRDKEIEGHLYGLVDSTPPGELADALYSEAVEALRSGYPREALYEDLGRLATSARESGDEEKQDDIIDVSNVLAGYCAPSVRI